MSAREMWKGSVVISTDQGAGRLHLCACGTAKWSAWGHARQHLAACPHAWEDAQVEADRRTSRGEPLVLA